jgi:hypothetical protein
VNELSQLIYLANIVGNAGFANGFLAMMLFFGCAVCVCLGFTFCPPHYSWEGDAESEERRENKIRRRFLAVGTLLGVLFLVSFIGGIFIPSRDTMYAIAASEMGEDVLNSETGGKAVEALNAWLDRQITAPADQ